MSQATSKKIVVNPLLMYTTKISMTNIPLAGLVGGTGSEIKGGCWEVGGFGIFPPLLCPADDSDDFETGPSDTPIIPRK